MDDGRMFRSSHIGLNVRDLERSVKFYTEVLGFCEVSRITLNGGMRIAFVELPEQFQIELVENPDSSERVDGSWNHVCIRVNKFDESYDKLVSAGVAFETEKLFFQEFWDHGMKFAFFRGPDGERLEIAEY